VDLLPALGLAGLLLVKEAGVPIPVPGDLLVIGAGIGAAAAGGGVAAAGLLGLILLAGYAGGSLQFLLVRGAFREPLLAVLRLAGVPEQRLERLAEWLRRRGASGVATARATPGVRVAAIAASGLAALRFGPFLGGLVIGNGLFVGAHFLLGVVVGPPALAAVSAAAGPVLVVAALAALAILGGAGWLVLRRQRERRGRASTIGRPPEQVAAEPLGLIDGLGAWADAACPACLAVELARGGSR
jgi:membrane protein DedA with SNARE-associated domain